MKYVAHITGHRTKVYDAALADELTRKETQHFCILRNKQQVNNNEPD